MTDTIKITYSDVEITYVEKTNKWNFTLRGRERNADSLEKAKEAIDKPEPISKAKKVEPIKAWMFAGYEDYRTKDITITSIADSPEWRGKEVWTMFGKERSKETLSKLFAVTPENEALRVKIVADQKEIERLRNGIRNMTARITTVDLSAWKEDK